jgi:peptide chain release factor 1
MVLPEAEEFDVQIDMNDVRVDFFLFFRTRWTIGKYYQISGAFNAYPTGLKAQCQDQNHNTRIKIKPLAYCVPRLYEQELAKKQAEDATKRTSQVSSGDRSNKIRVLCKSREITELV